MPTELHGGKRSTSYIRGCAEDDEKANQQMETSQTENMAPIDNEPIDDDDEEEETTFRCEVCEEGSFTTKKSTQRARTAGTLPTNGRPRGK